MANVYVILILLLCLGLQYADSFPQNFTSTNEAEETTVETSADSSTFYSEEATTIKYTTEQSNESESVEETFYLLPEYDTPTYRLHLSNFRLLNAHTNKIISEGRDFLKVSLKAMNALPDKTPGIEANITRMNNLLELIESIDLSKNSYDAIDRKAEIIEELSELYTDFATMLHYQVPKEDAAVLTLLFNKIDLHGFNVRIDESLARTVRKITKLVNRFFTKLTAEEKQKYRELLEWYEHFQKPKDDQDKFDDAVLLFQYLLLQPVG
ncbi:uncharacterized protein LOC118735838 [Rhagoletis pomonella]|uniref:uncharacterized protein LOC118735838 n=1 Tax=Rhagoletis pomonella TaxID=28610 RepID=UPI00177E70EF|nr:uncharacterized protein LOC118735838 [Rhagoletis pomonella]